MKLKSPLHLALMLAFAPALALAVPVAPSYEKFELTKAETAGVAKVTATKCPKKAGGPKYQAKCRQKLMGKSETRLNASYDRVMARLSTAARTELKERQEFWINDRYNECVWLSEDIEANPRPEAAVEIEYNDCALAELKRRTLWIERQN
jgi:uncharacterized protein YecT (DUF1311 family)